MILTRVTLHGFRSVQEELDSFWINEGLTILVGANEHGKSNLLDAISFLDDAQFKDEDRCRSKNFSPGSAKVPKIKFTLNLNSREKGLILKHIKTLQSSLPDVLDADTKAFSDRNKAVLGDLEKNELPQLDVSAQPGYVKSFYYTLRDGSSKLLNAKHPLNNSTQGFLEGLLPEVISYGPGVELPNTITLQELNDESFKEWEGLLKLGAGVWEQKEKLFENSLDGRDFRETSKDKIQKKLRAIWSQGQQTESNLKIDLELDTTTGKLNLDFIDRTGTRDQPSHRSLGFKSFFSFYLRLYAETSEIDPNGYIFTFDEPGLHLHPSGQKDLLREIRKISEKNQIIFSTHSPFLIDRRTSTKVIVVSKDHKGTSLDQKPYRKNWSPLRTSLGLVMNDSFFYADKTLLVEGTSDRILVASILQRYADDLDMDLNFLSIIDGDDRTVLPSIARILLAEEREIILLTDKDEGGHALIKQVSEIAKAMKRTAFFKPKHLGDFLTADHDLSIEDILPEGPFTVAVNRYLKEILKVDEVFDPNCIDCNGRSLGRAISDYFAEQKWIPKHSNFSKTTVADFFSQAMLSSDCQVTISDTHPSKIVCRKLRDLLDLK